MRIKSWWKGTERLVESTISSEKLSPAEQSEWLDFQKALVMSIPMNLSMTRKAYVCLTPSNTHVGDGIHILLRMSPLIEGYLNTS